MIRKTATAFVFMALAIPSFAQAVRTLEGYLGADELREEVFGVYMEGVAGILDLPWSECIEPGGDTVYTYQGSRLDGVMRIRDDGLACFDYGERRSPLQNCFVVSRQVGGGYVFSGGSQNGGQFKTTMVVRDVKSCPYEPTDAIG